MTAAVVGTPLAKILRINVEQFQDEFYAALKMRHETNLFMMTIQFKLKFT